MNVVQGPNKFEPQQKQREKGMRHVQTNIEALKLSSASVSASRPFSASVLMWASVERPNNDVYTEMDEASKWMQKSGDITPANYVSVTWNILSCDNTNNHIMLINYKTRIDNSERKYYMKVLLRGGIMVPTMQWRSPIVLLRRNSVVIYFAFTERRARLVDLVCGSDTYLKTRKTRLMGHVWTTLMGFAFISMIDVVQVRTMYHIKIKNSTIRGEGGLMRE